MVRLLAVTFLLAVVSCCHYSCSTCHLGESFTNCTACNSGSLTKLHDPDSEVTQMFFFHRYTGVCQQPLNPVFNLLGVFILVFGAGAFIFTHRRECLIFLNQVQNLSMLSLLPQVSFVAPLAYVLQSLQYLLIFAKTSRDMKNSDTKLSWQGYFQLYSFLTTSDYVENVMVMDVIIAVIGIIFILVTLLEALFLDRVKEEDRRRMLIKVLVQFSIFMRYLFYFTMMEQILMITLAFRFQSTYDGAKILIGFYFAVFIYFCVYSYYRPIKFFRSRYLMYFNYAKKIIFPILVCLPISPLILPGLMISCLFLQAIFQWRTNRTNRRLLAYRAQQLFVLVLVLTYIGVENNLNSLSSSTSAAIACVVFFAPFLLAPLVELSVFIYSKYLAAKVAQEITKPVMHDRNITEELYDNHINVTKENLRTSEMNDSNLQEIRLDMKLEEANPDADRNNIYQFDQDKDQDKDDQMKAEVEVNKTGKKLLALDLQITIDNDPKSNAMAMMNATQKSPKRRRIRDPEKDMKLRAAYGIKQ